MEQRSFDGTARLSDGFILLCVVAFLAFIFSPLPDRFFVAQLNNKAAHHDAAAEYALGERCSLRKNRDEDCDYFYYSAAEQGNIGAQMHIAQNPLHSQDSRSVFYWMHKAADQSYAPAEYGLGELYERGEGTARNSAEAFKWIHKAAGQGYAEAEFMLGMLYCGVGIKPDFAQAFIWFRRAALQGDAEAQLNLGWMYDIGKGVPQNNVQAFHWYQRAAEQGNVTAQTTLARMYHAGRGVERNDAAARKWLQTSLRYPNMTVDEVMSWAQKTAADVMTFNFTDYQQRMQQSRRYFTAQGWASFPDAQTKSQLIDPMINLHQVLTAQSGSAVMLRREILNGRYHWGLRVSLKLTSAHGGASGVDKIVVSLWITRVPSQENPAGVAIDKWMLDFVAPAENHGFQLIK